MRKVALVFVLAVIAPSLVLAWLAARSLRDQELAVERQQSLLSQGVADGLAQQVNERLAGLRREFNARVEALIGQAGPRGVTETFDARLREVWPLAEVGFVVTLDQQVLSPSLFAGPEARQFRLENERFLCSRELAHVYWSGLTAPANSATGARIIGEARSTGVNEFKVFPPTNLAVEANKFTDETRPSTVNTVTRPLPPSTPSAPENNAATPAAAVKTSAPPLTSEEAEFRQIVTTSTDGALARFLQNKLKLLFWYRPPRDPQLVFGAQVSVDRLVQALRDQLDLATPTASGLAGALLDDSGKPVAVSPPGFVANWKKPFVSAEIGGALPHWEVALYRLNPGHAGQAAATTRLAIGLLVALLVLAIGVGSWLIVADLKRQLALARQKTDFVSNVSHELKTPLTSIRMFSEMLAEGRVEDDARRRQFLGIITAETARLTRLINNVLDFARLERGERQYQFAECDLAALARHTGESYRPHLESHGYRLILELPSQPAPVRADVDALSQVLLNLLSNAEKYSGESREITMRVSAAGSEARLEVLDRGPGVPRGCEEKIFAEFFRAHDTLSSGISGSGLGLALARRIARAHGGDVTYAPRAGGGSCFTLHLPLGGGAKA